MALPTAPSERQLKHRRQNDVHNDVHIDVHVDARGDGGWDVAARLIDVRPRHTPRARGGRRAGSQTLAMPAPRPCGAPVDEAFDAYPSGQDALRPLPIDRCQAMRADGATTRTCFPRGHRAPHTSDH